MKGFTISPLLLCIAWLDGAVAFAFAPSPPVHLVRGESIPKNICLESPGLVHYSAHFSSTTRWLVVCQQSQNPNEIYGIARGYPILAFFFLLSAWFFTIPPEFRRAQFCATDVCLQDRCNDCMSVNEWTTGIQEYYQSGGGIKWDFSIDPKSKM